MDLLLKKTSVDDMKRHILPMILHSLESNSSQVQVRHTPLCVSIIVYSLSLLQELCVSILPTFVDMMDYSSMKHSIVPRMVFLCLNTESIAVSNW